MFKVITIEEKHIPMKSSGRTGRIYARYFNRDWLSDLMRFQSLGKEDNIDTSIIDRMAWVLAKTANEGIEDFEQWLDQFDTPTSIFNSFTEMKDLLFDSTKTVTKSKKKKKTNQRHSIR